MVTPFSRRRVDHPVGDQHHFEVGIVGILRGDFAYRLECKEEVGPFPGVAVVLRRVDVDLVAAAEQDEAIRLSFQERIDFLDSVATLGVGIERR